MKLFVVTHGIFLDKTRIAAGNSVRAYYLIKGLINAGHEVCYSYPAGLNNGSDISKPHDLPVMVCPYDSPEELAVLIKRENPDFLLAGYWELLEQLPEELTMPVIVDLVAPRILEALFQPERDLRAEARKMLQLYQKGDFFLVGNARQRDFLLPWLILAGFDCRWNIPVGVVPISTEISSQERQYNISEPICFVSGGVSWPWRKTQSWFDKIVDALDKRKPETGRLVLFQGGYIYSSQEDGKAEHGTSHTDRNSSREIRALLPYAEMRKFLSEQAHIGVELADKNIEREFSQSFRVVEFMRAGLPVICNDYLALSGLIKEYDAGWVVKSPEDLTVLVNQIMDHPHQLKVKSANALQLVDQHFDCNNTISPVLSFMQNPVKPLRGPALTTDEPVRNTAVQYAPENRAESFFFRLKRYLVACARRIGAKLRKNSAGKSGVISVTRSDVFPPDHGAAVKIDRTAASLSRLVDYVCLVTDDRKQYCLYKNGKMEFKSYPLLLRFIGPYSRSVRRKLIKAGVPGDDVFLYYPLYDWSYIVRTLYLGLKYPAQVYLSEFPAYARACIWGRSIFGGKVVISEHNVEYDRLRQQNSQLSSKGFNFLQNTEIRLFNQADKVITVSENDKRILVRDGADQRRIVYIPHGIDLEQFDKALDIDVRARYNINQDEALLVYHGTYLYPPNLEAVRLMADIILPGLEKMGIKARLMAVGPHPPEDKLRNIVFTGSVEHVAPYLKKADIAVVPLLKGGGTRMKILDYFAAGLPVVSTAKGIEGIDAKNKEQAVILEHPDEKFIMAVKNLLENKDKAQALGKAARNFAEQLDWKIIGRRYYEAMGFDDIKG